MGWGGSSETSSSRSGPWGVFEHGGSLDLLGESHCSGISVNPLGWDKKVVAPHYPRQAGGCSGNPVAMESVLEPVLFATAAASTAADGVADGDAWVRTSASADDCAR